MILFPHSRVNKALYQIHPSETKTSRLRRPFKLFNSSFVAPFEGIYYFHFRGYKGSDSCDAYFHVNGDSELFKCPRHTSEGGLVSWSVMKWLKRRDVVYLKSARQEPKKGNFFSCSTNYKMEFIGQLIQISDSGQPLIPTS
eukprot:TRINITY_DN19141_c0_g1_i1.p1 TRINITY_DN19141_c0_g1~~TRINITY_DN19141_c0_g1_i1.p1  ORF type:complete len:141 (-),score=8.51 TRINITY_DN19141_c0_g1_i1:55-477(-)